MLVKLTYVLFLTTEWLIILASLLALALILAVCIAVNSRRR
jgi:hypothetical protein